MIGARASQLYRFLTVAKIPRSWAHVLFAQQLAAHRARLLIRAGYYFPALWMLSHTADWQRISTPVHPDLLWPTAWLSFLDVHVAGPVLFWAAIAGASAGAVFSRFSSSRLLVFVCLLEFLSLKFSFGKIHHLMHAWLLVMFVWIFLPDGWQQAGGQTRSVQRRLLFLFGSAQFVAAMTYALSGFGKLGGVVYQLARGEVTSLHPSALARHLAERLQQTGETAPWGPWMIEHGHLFWPLMLAVFYLQVFAVHLAARPQLHRLLGIGLVGFHVMSLLAMAIDFTPAIPLLVLLFVLSPFAPSTDGGQLRAFSSAFEQLPLVPALRGIKRRTRRSSAKR
ncbi:MAG: hypothetical protein RJA70_1178 [Pseudomonadota bacterium]|jgi:hypothetical protein